MNNSNSNLNLIIENNLKIIAQATQAKNSMFKYLNMIQMNIINNIQKHQVELFVKTIKPFKT